MKYLPFFAMFLISISCGTVQDEIEANEETVKQKGGDPVLDYGLELSPEQEAAFDALDRLQTNTDDISQLYSTFANIEQPCYPADTSIHISRAYLLKSMKHFVTKHCTLMPVEERERLASAAVLAQEEYLVKHCTQGFTDHNYENGLPMTGIWVMPNVLGHRDVLLVW